MDTTQSIFGGVCLRLYLGQQLLPGAVLGPTVEPLVDRVPLPEPLRHVPPRRPGAVLPRHAFYSEAGDPSTAANARSPSASAVPSRTTYRQRSPSASPF